MLIPYISILTPTHNRENYIINLGKSLHKQNIKNIEWIIGDDGSTDKTQKVIEELSLFLEIKIIYLKSSKRIGKASMDNILIKHARGQYVVWCDSDDYFVDNSFIEIKRFLREIDSQNKNLSGAIFQNVNQDGVSQSYKGNIPKHKEIVNFEQMKNYLKGDATIFLKNKIIKKINFKEVDFLISEGTELDKILNEKYFYISNKIVKIMNRTAKDSVSFGKKLRFSRGMAHSMFEYMDDNKVMQLSLRDKFYEISNLWRYSIHGDISIFLVWKIWPVLKKNKYLFFFLIPGILLAIIDIISFKVEKTHVEFERNKKNYKLTVNNIK
jgi:glycosyltransferase involved in cell wall biosynthesis